MRPLASQRIESGLATPSFSEAKRFTAKPLAGRNAFCSSIGSSSALRAGKVGCGVSLGLALPTATTEICCSALLISVGNCAHSSRMVGTLLRPMLNTRRLSSPNKHFQFDGRQYSRHKRCFSRTAACKSSRLAKPCGREMPRPVAMRWASAA